MQKFTSVGKTFFREVWRSYRFFVEIFLSEDVVYMGNSLTILQSQVTESFKILDVEEFTQ